VLQPDPTSHELVLTAIHPNTELAAVLASTGWPLRVADDLATNAPPSKEELRILRDLKERTVVAHAEG
jgi:glutaconate CoA-transferase subunit B